MLTIAEKEVMRRIARLAMLEEDLLQREIQHKRAFKERPRDELGRWLPQEEVRTSYEETAEESQLESIRKIKVVKNKQLPHTYDVKETGFSKEDLKDLVAVIGVLGAFLLAVFT